MQQGKPWTKDEESFLMANVGEYSVKELSQLMDRTHLSIVNKLHHLRAKNGVKAHKRWTTKEDNFLRNNLHMTKKAIADALFRSTYAVGTRLWRLGLQLNGAKPVVANFVKSEKVATNNVSMNLLIEKTELLKRLIPSLSGYNYSIKENGSMLEFNIHI